ncbi:hypothetical protein [Paraglaciecola sp. T6c]|uniref:hypothetical protein n=1 Tax=Pseudoalteromonas atlantica (strain T6c / ATCC BAA-1087) TaxID=3042615 RepID=UPI0003150F90|nr:hypothetical protein [Paraglaciecola sp. T6c]
MRKVTFGTRKTLSVGLWVLLPCLSACSTSSQPNQQERSTQQIENSATQVIDIKPKYVTNFSASGKPYYHLSFTLDIENVVQVERYTVQEFEQNGGQFEVLLKKSAFPIQAPNCNSNLILRMPWVPSSVDLTLKYQLYKSILAVSLGQTEHVSVVVELNPYVQETEQGLELTQCNLFFRHANSRYVPHTRSVN